MPPFILTHRGLDPSIPNFFSESSIEAFAAHLSRGFSLEFDFNLTADGEVVILHDATLSRITSGADNRSVRSVTSSELKVMPFKNGSICFLKDLAPLITAADAPLHALHIKGNLQDQEALEILIKALAEYPLLIPKLFAFDVRPDTAQLLQRHLPDLQRGMSIAHPYDVERYAKCVYMTLFTPEQALLYADLFQWIWLDEWDLESETGEKKYFYTQQTFDELHTAGFKLSLVTPELHGTSPGLLGSEKHPDSENTEVLFSRIQTILALKPDGICTDYPDKVKSLID